MTRQFTGRHFFFIIVGGFGVVVAVNMLLLFSALRTFPGLEVTNSYVASQKFDRLAAAQRGLGWTAEGNYENGHLSLRLTDADGAIVRPQTLSVMIGRPATDHFDQFVELRPERDGYGLDIPLAAGGWQIRIEATAEDGTLFAQRLLVGGAR